MTIITTNPEREDKASGRDDRGVSAKVFAVGGSREGGGRNGRYKRPLGKFQCSGNRRARFQHQADRTQYSTRVDGIYSGRTDNRTPMTTEYQERTIGGGSASGPKNDDGRCAQRRPHGIQSFNCGLLGHTRNGCPRGRRRNLNGIGRTKTIPPSYPK
jgi:hypothetical protein